MPTTNEIARTTAVPRYRIYPLIDVDGWPIGRRFAISDQTSSDLRPTAYVVSESELHGMIDRWKQAGKPLDESANHPMTPWAQAIGGILKVNGYTDFLANYGTRRTEDDPIKDALAILGAAIPDQSLRPAELAELAVKEGLAKTLFSPNERDTPRGRERAIGKVLSKHLQDTLEASTETTRYRLKLEGGYRRWEQGKKAQKRYVFTVLEEQSIPLDQ